MAFWSCFSSFGDERESVYMDVLGVASRRVVCEPGPGEGVVVDV